MAIIYTILGYIKNILDLERLFPRVICPFCPVFFGYKLRKYLRDKVLLLSIAEKLTKDFREIITIIEIQYA